MSLGISEILLILIAAVVLFGGKRIPELARTLGKLESEYKKAKNVFKNEIGEFQAEVEKTTHSEEKRPHIKRKAEKQHGK